MDKVKKTFLYVALSIWAIIQVFPLYYLITFSLKSNGEILGENILGLPIKWLWSNYRKVLNESNLLRYLGNSVFVTVITILCVIIISLMAAYALYRMKWRLQGFFIMFFMLGLTVPIHSSVLPVFVILKKIRLLDTYWALILPYIAFSLSMAILMCSGFLKGVPVELEEAACMDGCGVYKIFWRIIVPVMKPAFTTVAIFTYLSSWNELMFSTIFINSDKFRTLPVGIQMLSSSLITDWGVVGAALVLSLIPTMILYICLSQKVQEGMVMGAVKG